MLLCLSAEDKYVRGMSEILMQVKIAKGSLKIYKKNPRRGRKQLSIKKNTPSPVCAYGNYLTKVGKSSLYQHVPRPSNFN